MRAIVEFEENRVIGRRMLLCIISGDVEMGPKGPLAEGAAAASSSSSAEQVHLIHPLFPSLPTHSQSQSDRTLQLISDSTKRNMRQWRRRTTL